VIAFAAAAYGYAQQPSADDTFVLHKFAKAIGRETCSINQNAEFRTLASHFLFNDRGTNVPLEATFVSKTKDMTPILFKASGRSARFFQMDDMLTVYANRLIIVRSGKQETVTPKRPWFITDGYSPVCMQQQMMRWWLTHGRPTEFTAYPAKAKIQILPSEALQVGGKTTYGYNVNGLIWGGESLWIDDAGTLIALVSTDAEFDHFEAVRAQYEASLNDFIAAAVRANLSALRRLTKTAGTPPPMHLAILGATLEDSTGAPPIKDSAILINHGVIAAAGPRSKIAIPKDATVLDDTGKYAVPGLWDMHAHYEQVEWGPIYLAAGVTSVRDVGNEFEFIKTLHEELDRPEHPAIGPHIEFAGIIDGTGPVSLGAITADTPEQAPAWVEKYQAIGARQIKIYSSVKPEVVKAITAAAHERGMTVTGHIPHGMTAMDGVAAGMDQINHLDYLTSYFVSLPPGADGRPDPNGIPEPQLDSDRAKELIEVLRQHNTVLDPTLTVYELTGHVLPMDQVEPGVAHLPPQLKVLVTPPLTAAQDKAFVERRQLIRREIIRRLHAAGIPIVAGTDQVIPGYSLHREMELYVEAGFTPLEALQSATLQAARAVGRERDSGSLEAGKRGDVVLLDADPLADIHNTRRVWRTVAGGLVYDPAPLWRSVGFLP
jgi:imidazolonepropionase-like amidohydrolase